MTEFIAGCPWRSPACVTTLIGYHQERLPVGFTCIALFEKSGLTARAFCVLRSLFLLSHCRRRHRLGQFHDFRPKMLFRSITWGLSAQLKRSTVRRLRILPASDIW